MCIELWPLDLASMESLNHGACPRHQQDSLSLYLLLGHGCGRVPDRRLREERFESTSQFLGGGGWSQSITAEDVAEKAVLQLTRKRKEMEAGL